MIPRPPRSTLLPYTTLFLSVRARRRHDRAAALAATGSLPVHVAGLPGPLAGLLRAEHLAAALEDRKSTRLNSSHANISYAVFCLKKKSELQSRQYIVFRLLL